MIDVNKTPLPKKAPTPSMLDCPLISLIASIFLGLVIFGADLGQKVVTTAEYFIGYHMVKNHDL